MTLLSCTGIAGIPAPLRRACATAVVAAASACLLGNPAMAATHSVTNDSFTKSVRANENYGGRELVRAQKWADITTFAKFDISRYRETDIQSAQLRIAVKDVPLGGTVTLHRVLGNWTEKGITYSNQPRLGGSVASFNVRSSDEGKVLTVDVTSLLRKMAGTTSGAYGIAFKSPNGNVHMRSKESGAPIQLVVNGTASGGSGDGTSGGTDGSGTGNTAPSISGTPPTSVTVATQYSFRPNAGDADGDTLQFSVSRKPTWANFNTSTGQLAGTPSASHVGRYEDVGIAVSDGKVSKSLTPFDITVDAASNGRVTLSWLPPTENTDGSALTNLRSYRINWRRSDTGATGSVTINNPGIANYVVDNLAEGRYSFTIVAINSSNVSSNPSNSATTTVY